MGCEGTLGSARGRRVRDSGGILEKVNGAYPSAPTTAPHHLNLPPEGARSLTGANQSPGEENPSLCYATPGATARGSVEAADSQSEPRGAKNLISLHFLLLLLVIIISNTTEL